MSTQANASPVSFWDMTPEEVRERINQRVMAIDAPIPAVGTIEDKELNFGNRTTPIRIYTPVQGNYFPVILLVHGGAWVAGNLDTHDNLARYLCSKAPAVVVSVGYLNAPEGKFPSSLEQCYDALTWVVEHRNEISSSQSGLAVVGDSAGGNMVAALCLMTRDRSGPLIDLQVLINPAPDLTCGGTLIRQGDALDNLRWQAVQYLTAPEDADHPYVSPLKAKDLSKLPAALILVAEQDDLRPSGEEFGHRLQASSIPVQIYCQKGINHLAGDGAKASAKAEESLKVAIDAIQRAFSQVDITFAANQYLSILNNIGSALQDPREIAKLCAQNCKKIRNGKVLFDTSERFAEQLAVAKDWLGGWSIQTTEVLPVPDHRSAVIRYELATEKEGKLLVFVVLKFDEHHLICEIDEVHNRQET